MDAAGKEYMNVVPAGVSGCLSHYFGYVHIEPKCLGAETWRIHEVDGGLYQLEGTEGETGEYIGWESNSTKAVLHRSINGTMSNNTMFEIAEYAPG